MYAVVLALHNIVRWVVLAAGVFTVWHVWRSWVRRAPWSGTDARAGRLYVMAVSAQFALGVLLYALSPVVHHAFSDVGAAMHDPATRFFFVEHEVVMVAGIALAHIGAARVRRATSDSARFQTATIWYGISVAAIAGFIPWGRPLFPTW
jgi:hypothetical protein